MFGRGSWAIVGLVKESLEAFKASLEEPSRMAAASQLAASAIARIYGADALGINPFGAPRLDEEQELGQPEQEQLSRHALAEQQDGSEEVLPAAILDSPAFGRSAASFELHSTLPWYGIWAVSNEWKKASDLPSIREQRSYVTRERPYRFLQPPDKKSVDQETLDATTLVRRHVPVLLDFNEGRVYIESTDKKLIYAVIVQLSRLGAEIVPVAWNYNSPKWTEVILNRLYEQTLYGDEFLKRAEEAKRFKDNEIEKLEDRELESIVAKFFSMTELPGGIWVGISGPARLRLHPEAPPVGVRAPTSATTLLGMSDDAAIVTGALTFQEQLMLPSKDGGERRVRRDLARIDLNDRINLSDVGAAMLRGFDLSTHRKDVQRQIRLTKQVPSIQQFWGAWLHQLSSAVRVIESVFREVLDISGSEQAGIVPLKISEKPAASDIFNA